MPILAAVMLATKTILSKHDGRGHDYASSHSTVDKLEFTLHLVFYLVHLLPCSLGPLIGLQRSLWIFPMAEFPKPKGGSTGRGFKTETILTCMTSTCIFQKGRGGNYRASPPLQITGQCCPTKMGDSRDLGRKNYTQGSPFSGFLILSCPKWQAIWVKVATRQK